MMEACHDGSTVKNHFVWWPEVVYRSVVGKQLSRTLILARHSVAYSARRL